MHCHLVRVPACSSLCLRRSKVRSHQSFKFRGSKTLINDDDLSRRGDGETIDHIDQFSLVNFSYTQPPIVKCSTYMGLCLLFAKGRMDWITVDEERNRRTWWRSSFFMRVDGSASGLL